MQINWQYVNRAFSRFLFGFKCLQIGLAFKKLDTNRHRRNPIFDTNGKIWCKVLAGHAISIPLAVIIIEFHQSKNN